MPVREPSRNSSVDAVRWPDPAIPAARLLHQRPPPSNVDLDPELSGRGPNAPPGGIALSVRNASNLVESRHRVAHVARVGDRLLALLGEGEALRRKPVLLARGQCLPLFRCQIHTSRIGNAYAESDYARRLFESLITSIGRRTFLDSRIGLATTPLAVGSPSRHQL